MNNLHFFFLLLLPYLSFSQNYAIDFSSDSVCEGEDVRLTAKGCDASVVWYNGKKGRSILEKAEFGTSYFFSCNNSVSNQELGKSDVQGINVLKKPQTPFLLCNVDEIKQGRTAKITVFGCDGDVIWNHGGGNPELVVRPLETKTYTAKCVNALNCESDPISRTIIVKSRNGEDEPKVTVKSACFGESLILKANGCTAGEYIWYRNEVLSKNAGFTAKEVGKGHEFKIDQGADDTEVFYTARCLFQDCLGNESNRLYAIFDDRLPSIDFPNKVYLDEGETVDLLSLLPVPQSQGNTFVIGRTRDVNNSIVQSPSNISVAGNFYVQEVSKEGKCTSPSAKVKVILTGEYALQENNNTVLNKAELNEMPTQAEALTKQSTAVGAVISSLKENDVLNDVEIAEGLSPNGDGINDVFIIKSSQEVQLRVYNRFGHLVYENENYKNTWKGDTNTSKSEKNNIGLPDGTYYYVIRTADGRQKISFLTLQR